MKKVFIEPKALHVEDFNSEIESKYQEDIIVLDTIGNGETLANKYQFIKNARNIKISNKDKKYKLSKKSLIYINIDENTTKNQLTNIIHILVYNEKNIGIQAQNRIFLGWLSKEIDNELYKDFLECLKALSYENVKERYNYIYDIVYNKINEIFKNNNICDFEDDKCIASREGKSAHDTMILSNIQNLH